MRTKLIRAVALMTLFTFLPGAAQNSREQPPVATFSSRAELVLVPAIVTDKSGAHVSGLAKADFSVLENGSEQKIAAFEEVHAVTAPAHRASAITPGGLFTNVPIAEMETPRRITILLLDMLNTTFLDQMSAREQLIHSLRASVHPDELVTLLALQRGGVKVLHDFTTDSTVLIAALKRVRGQPGAMESENMDAVHADSLGAGNGAAAITATATLDPSAMNITGGAGGASGAADAAAAAEARAIEALFNFQQAEMARIQQGMATYATLDALRSIARGYTGIPGRKALIWISGSFPLPIEKVGERSYGPDQEQVEHVFDLLNAANISMYPVDSRGLITALPAAADNVRANRRDMALQTNSRMEILAGSEETLQAFASRTGGRAFSGTNDLAAAVTRANEDSASYYMLGYYRETRDTRPGWRKLEVKVRRDNVRVRARDGFFVQRTRYDDAKLRDAEIASAVQSPFDSTALLIGIRWVPPVDKPPAPARTAPRDGSKKLVGYEIRLPASGVTVQDDDNNHMSCEFVALARDASAAEHDRRDDTIDGHLKQQTADKIRAAGLQFSNNLLLPPGEYNVRFVVRDNLNGRVGSVTAPLTVK